MTHRLSSVQSVPSVTTVLLFPTTNIQKPTTALIHSCLLLQPLLFFVTVEIRNALGHPLWFRCAFQKMVEELLQPYRVILLVCPTSQPMRFAIVGEQIRFF